MIDRDAIRARCEAATPGPWEPKRDPGIADEALMCGEALTVGGDPMPPGGMWWVHHPGWIDCEDYGLFASEADAAFIAAARTDVPELLTEVERLQAIVDELVAEANGTCDCCTGPGFGQGEHRHSDATCEHPCCPDADLDDDAYVAALETPDDPDAGRRGD